MEEANYGNSNRWLTALTMDKKMVGISRNKIIDFLGKESIESRPCMETYAYAAFI